MAIDDESFEAFCEEWQSWVGKLGPTVAAKPRSFDRGFLINATTPSCARFDVFVRRVALVALGAHHTFPRTLSVLPMLLERGELVRLTQHDRCLAMRPRPERRSMEQCLWT